MINFVSNWTQSLIIALIFTIIIEMLLPNNSNKKYVKMVAGIYLIFIMLNPILNLFNKDIKLNFGLEDVFETSADVNIEEMKKYYKSSLQTSIAYELRKQGYDVKKIELEFNSDATEITKLIVYTVNLENVNEITEFLVQNCNVNQNNIYFK